jgi:F-box-like
MQQQASARWQTGMLGLDMRSIPQHKSRETSKYFRWPVSASSLSLLTIITQLFLAAGSNRPAQILPNELLLHIFSYVKGKRDLANLCQCSKVSRNIAEGYLYRNLNLYFKPKSKNAPSFKLLQSIQKSRYSSIVKELTVDVGRCVVAPRLRNEGCSCTKIDMLLRKALCYAEALEVLKIRCDFCRFALPERHSYLAELPTTKLRELYYECYCYSDGSIPNHVSAPNWVHSLTSLSLGSGSQRVCREEDLQSWMQNGAFLPNVHTLNYYGPGICSELLATRVIRRLVVPSHNPNDALSRHPDKKALTHLIAPADHPETFLSTVGNINQFSNLQHIGSLWHEDFQVSSILCYSY